jgi:hypothetical protein
VKDEWITLRRRGKVFDPVLPDGDVLGNPQSRDHVDAPGRAEVAQLLEARGRLLGHTDAPRNVIDSNEGLDEYLLCRAFRALAELLL